jgi:diphthine-ammonia ligase
LRACVLFSGGKDSTYTAQIASRNDTLMCLVTLIPEKDDSYMFHFPNIKWTSLQAYALGVPQFVQHTKGEKEEELKDLMLALKQVKSLFDVECVYTGAIRSSYQKERAERVCSSLGLKCISPLWNVNQENYMRKLVEEGYRAIITSVSALGLDEGFLGKELDRKTTESIIQRARKYEFNPALEGGEGETFVIDCPNFKSAIKITKYDKIWDGYTGRLIIRDAILVPKNSRVAEV